MPVERLFLMDDAAPFGAAARNWWTSAQLAGDVWLAFDAVPPAEIVRELAPSDAEKVRGFDVRQLAASLAPTVAAVPTPVRRSAWWSAIRGLSPAARRTLALGLADSAPALSWWRFAAEIDDAALELHAAERNFADVALEVRKTVGSGEAARWEILAEIERLVADRLQGRIPAPQSAPAQLVLVGCGWIPERTKTSLRRAAIETSIWVLISAQAEEADRFDEFGGLVRRGEPLALELRSDMLHVAATPAEAARTAFAFVPAAESCTMVLADRDWAPSFDAYARRYTIDFPPSGRALSQTAPAKLLATLAEYLEVRTYEAFAALLRHPDWAAALDARRPEGAHSTTWTIAEFDELATDHLPRAVPTIWQKDGSAHAAANEMTVRVATLLESFGAEDKTLGAWVVDAIRPLLATVFGNRPTPGLAELQQRLEESAAATGAGATPIAVAQALRLVVEGLDDETLPGEIQRGNVRRLDWPAAMYSSDERVIVAGFNDGRIPSVDRDSPLLGESLRRRFGFLDNDARLALDRYRLRMLMGTRRQVALIAARTTTRGEPLLPSRLWFASPLAELPDRVQAFFDPPPRSAAAPERSNRPVDLDFPMPPAPPPQPEIAGMRVTGFRDYLACPYRFYLRHVLKLQESNPPGVELDGGQFGSIAHDVLECLREPRLVGEADAVRLAEFFSAELDRRVLKQFGADPPPAVRIQTEQIRLRLERFAEVQAAWAADGWRVWQTETPPDPEAAVLDVDGRPFKLRARIDRIDFHEARGEWAVIDYKTGDSADEPDRTHRDRDRRWIDLQLPLYWHLSKVLHGGRNVRVGYALLTKELGRIGFAWTDWSASDLDAACREAVNIARDIRAGKFWPPTQPAPEYFDEFAGICRDDVRRAGGDAA